MSQMEKRIAGALIGIGAMGLIFGLFQLKGNINAPFAKKNLGKGFLSQNQDETALLQGRDTDKDGLTDFDELYLYKTSPYLEDTDSDGILDKEEIDAGANPNCHKDKNCSWQSEAPLPAPEAETSENQAAKLLEQLGTFGGNQQQTTNNPQPATSNNQQPSGGEQPSPEQMESLKNMKAADLREFLKKSGVSEEIFSKFDDATLEKLFKQTLEKIGQ